MAQPNDVLLAASGHAPWLDSLCVTVCHTCCILSLGVLPQTSQECVDRESSALVFLTLENVIHRMNRLIR